MAKLEVKRGNTAYLPEKGMWGMAIQRANGSVNPAGIIAPAIVATAVSTAVAVVYCKMMDRRRRE